MPSQPPWSHNQRDTASQPANHTHGPETRSKPKPTSCYNTLGKRVVSADDGVVEEECLAVEASPVLAAGLGEGEGQGQPRLVELREATGLRLARRGADQLVIPLGSGHLARISR